MQHAPSTPPDDALPPILAHPWPRRTIYAVASLADCPAAQAARALNEGLERVRSAHTRAKILAAARHVGIEPLPDGRARIAGDERRERSA